MDAWHCKTHLRPERGDHEFVPTRFFHRVDNSLVLPRIDKGAIDRWLIWKDTLNALGLLERREVTALRLSRG